MPCKSCRRRAELLAVHSGVIDHHRYDRQALARLLALGHDELARALTAQAPAATPDPPPATGQADAAAHHRRPPTAHADADARIGGGWELCSHDDGFPAGLHDLDGTILLHGRGDPGRARELLGAAAVAIVGTRRPSEYGRAVARSLAGGLAGCGVCIVSGLAMGIDSEAHLGALEAGGPTLAVLPGGADVAYPATRRALYRRLCAEAGVVSELPSGARPRRWCFIARNRLIAALAGVTVVVEARARSGALVTAGYARDLGREVAGVPGPVTADCSRGPHALIRDGAHLVRDAGDVLDLLYGVGARPAPAQTSLVDGRLAELLERVHDGHDTPGALIEAGVPVAEALTGLARLELAGCVRRTPSGRYLPVL